MLSCSKVHSLLVQIFWESTYVHVHGVYIATRFRVKHRKGFAGGGLLREEGREGVVSTALLLFRF